MKKNEDLLGEVTKKYQEIKEQKIKKQLMGKGEREHLFHWTIPIVRYLLRNKKATTDQIRIYLQSNYIKQYEDLPDHIINQRIESTLVNLTKKGSLKRLKGLEVENLLSYDTKIEKFGESWEIVDVMNSKREKIKRFLEQFKK